MNIAFLSRVNRQFSGQTIEKHGLGGTQSALIYLAESLAALDNQVTIFCHCKEETGIYNGVRYLEVSELINFAKTNPIDYFVSVADESALKLGINAKKTLWWSHNDYYHLWDNSFPDILANMSAVLGTKTDKLIVVSEWHLNKLAGLLNIPPDHFQVFRNGVQTKLFDKTDIERDPYRLIYTSVPDRGLDLLFDFFPLIKKEIPQASLHVFSNFDLWGKDAAWCKEMSGDIFGKAASDGIVIHKTVNKAVLAEELLKSSIFVYPNHDAPKTNFFAETSCIAALEAQAAGLPVITSNRGALYETVVDNQTGILIDADPYSPGYKEEFIKAVLELLRNKDKRDLFGQNARNRIFNNYSWKIIAAGWDAKLKEWLSSAESTKLKTAPLMNKFKQPEVTVIIPTYNREKNLKHMLNSLVAQTHEAFEVIICDDGSTDNTKELVNSFKAKLNIRYLYQPKAGFRPGPARNMGLKTARGKLIIFLDSDIIVPSTFIDAHVTAHSSIGNYIVNSYVWRMNEYNDDDLGLEPDRYVGLHKDNLKPDSRDRYELFERGEAEETYFLDSNALSVKRGDIEKIGGFDEDFVGWGHEDTELGYRFGGIGYTLKFIKDGAESYHQYHDFSPSKEEERLINWERLRKKYNIEKWYKPLWEIRVTGNAELEIEGLNPGITETIIESEFLIKTGYKLTNPDKPLVKLKIRDGILTEIRLNDLFA